MFGWNLLYQEISLVEQSGMEMEYGPVKSGCWPDALNLIDDLKITRKKLVQLWKKLEYDYDISVPYQLKKTAKTIGDIKKLITEYLCVI